MGFLKKPKVPAPPAPPPIAPMSPLFHRQTPPAGSGLGGTYLTQGMKLGSSSSGKVSLGL